MFCKEVFILSNALPRNPGMAGMGLFNACLYDVAMSAIVTGPDVTDNISWRYRSWFCNRVSDSVQHGLAITPSTTGNPLSKPPPLRYLCLQRPTEMSISRNSRAEGKRDTQSEAKSSLLIDPAA